MKKNIFTGKLEPLTESDYPWLRDQFLNDFMKKTYRKRSLYEIHGYGMFGTLGDGTGDLPTQPRDRKRYLAEDGYGGKYQPKSIHESEAIGKPDKFMVIGRYYTVNLGWKHIKVRALDLTSGKVKSVNIDVA